MSDKTCILFNDVANDMLRSFVRMYSILYGEDTINYNVHGLIHVPNFVKLHGQNYKKWYLSLRRYI